MSLSLQIFHIQKEVWGYAKKETHEAPKIAKEKNGIHEVSIVLKK
jgi:hypothetical protein